MTILGVSVLILVGGGFVLLASAGEETGRTLYHSAGYFVTHQAIWLGVAMVFLLAATYFDYHNWRRYPFLTICLYLIVVALMICCAVGVMTVYSSKTLFSDEGKELDSVFSNKTVIMHFIEWLKQTNESSPGLLRVLAHVFKKFPEMWKMNWMFIRHKGKNKKQARTHRLAEYVFRPTSRPDAYFASDALLSDFIYKYYSESSGRDSKCLR